MDLSWRVLAFLCLAKRTQGPNPSIRGLGAPMDALSALPWTARWCQGTLPTLPYLGPSFLSSALCVTINGHEMVRLGAGLGRRTGSHGAAVRGAPGSLQLS